VRALVGSIAMLLFLTAIALAADVGPAADVASVRAAAHAKNPKSQLLGVHVVGNYGLSDWAEGESSGYGVYKRVSGQQWKQIDWGGGAIDVDLLVKDGMSRQTAQQLCSGWGDSSPC